MKTPSRKVYALASLLTLIGVFASGNPRRIATYMMRRFIMKQVGITLRRTIK